MVGRLPLRSFGRILRGYAVRGGASIAAAALGEFMVGKRRAGKTVWQLVGHWSSFENRGCILRTRSGKAP